ncbi:hypothetical protein KKF91_19990 [Myxococcota bacterium]|nr:hypothetical protein [Myxococcota bacterium]MBU1432827.1 hypothetical protein [Myxococcota bacterium]MBU1897547.1 hypothetical protein [Myxococcota bacterium]
MNKPTLLKMIERVEAQTAAQMSRALRQPKLLSAAMTWMEVGMRGRTLARGVGERLAGFWGLPTAAQLRANMEILTRIEARLAELEAKGEADDAPR